jgi:hypothetical protein
MGVGETGIIVGRSCIALVMGVVVVKDDSSAGGVVSVVSVVVVVVVLPQPTSNRSMKSTNNPLLLQTPVIIWRIFRIELGSCTDFLCFVSGNLQNQGKRDTELLP